MNDLILIALISEAPNLYSKYENVFHTGVGKVNAALTAAQLIERYKPNRVFNFGTAGGITVNHGGLYKCTKFSQRDMHVSGCLVGQELVDHLSPIEFSISGLHLSTGDNFVTDPAEAKGADLVDMEAYAIAKACNATGTEFICYKYISDMADENAADHFLDNIHKGEEHYERILEQYSVALEPRTV